MSNVTITVEALNILLAAAGAATIEPSAPAVTQPKAEPEVEFVTWLRDTAEARHARKDRNRSVLAPKLDRTRPGWRGAANRDAIWAAAKNGKRIPAVKA